MKTIGLFIFYWSWYAVTWAQSTSFSSYQALRCQGEFPADFRYSLSEKVEQTKGEVKDLSKKEKEYRIQFSELSHYSLENILWSGKILYGDTLSRYINAVADKALQAEPGLRKELRFYVLKSSDLNAYSTDHGAIFVSLGLLARIRSESQLAFILCHEAIHYKNHHNYQTFVKKQDLSKDKQMAGNDQKTHQMMQYSKAFELEADAEGLSLFLKSPYSTKEVNDLFDVLLYAYLPFGNQVFDSTYFDKPGYKLPQNFFLSRVQELKPEEEIADSMHSHPNIKTRRSKIKELMEAAGKTDGLLFTMTEASFHYIQQVARYELAIVHLQDVELEEAIYAAYLIEKMYGKSLFSDQLLGSALYTLAIQKNYGTYNEKRISRVKSTFLSDDKNNAYWNVVEGESQAVYYFVFKIPKKDLNILAAQKLYELYTLYKAPFFLQRMNQLMEELLLTTEIKEPGFFKDYLLDPSGRIIEDSIHVKINGSSDKHINITRFRGYRYDASNYGYTYNNYAFSGRLDDTLYQNTVERINRLLKQKTVNETDARYQKFKYASARYHEKHGANLGLDSLCLLRPQYSSTIQTLYSSGRYTYKSNIRNPKVSPLNEIEMEDLLISQIKQAATKLNLGVELAGRQNQKQMNTDAFNRYQAYKMFFYEKLSLGAMKVFTFSAFGMDKYISDQPYLGFNYVLHKNKTMHFGFLVYDLRNGSLLMEKDLTYKNKKISGKSLSSVYYKTLGEVKHRAEGIERLKARYGIK